MEFYSELNFPQGRGLLQSSGGDLQAAVNLYFSRVASPVPSAPRARVAPHCPALASSLPAESSESDVEEINPISSHHVAPANHSSASTVLCATVTAPSTAAAASIAGVVTNPARNTAQAPILSLLEGCRGAAVQQRPQSAQPAQAVRPAAARKRKRAAAAGPLPRKRRSVKPSTGVFEMECFGAS